jgi:PEP-CTERM motif
MKKTLKVGTYLLAVAFALAITLYGGIAKADGDSSGHPEGSWSGDNDNDGLKSDFKTSEDQDNDGWVSYKHEDSDDGDWSDDDGGKGKEGDPGPKSMPEPSSLALLSVGMLGLGAFLRHRTHNLAVRQAL